MSLVLSRQTQQRAEMRDMGECERKISQKRPVLMTYFFGKQPKVVGVGFQPNKQILRLFNPSGDGKRFHQPEAAR